MVSTNADSQRPIPVPEKPAAAGARGVPIRRLARAPLLLKILVANAAIVVVGAVAGTAISLRHGALHPGAPHYDLMALFVVAGVAVSVVVNFLVLRAVLRPLEHLQRAVDAVAAGQRGVRVARDGLSDDRLDHLADTFDRMIAALEDHAERLRLLPGQILRAQEEERRRVARELHDEAAQSLTSLLVRLRLLEQAQTPEMAQQRVAELRQLTARALDDVRRIAVELRPSMLDDLGLVAAVQAHVDDLNASGVRATLAADGLDGRLPSEIELALYRVAQEALTNVVRHARASAVTVRLSRSGRQVTLEVQDDGIGFDAASPQRPGGLGLAGMRERMALIGGDVRIHAQAGRGTRIVATADLPHIG
jgi:two-component system sensor histidine kinase UhpB